MRNYFYWLNKRLTFIYLLFLILILLFSNCELKRIYEQNKGDLVLSIVSVDILVDSYEIIASRNNNEDLYYSTSKNVFEIQNILHGDWIINILALDTNKNPIGYTAKEVNIEKYKKNLIDIEIQKFSPSNAFTATWKTDIHTLGQSCDQIGLPFEENKYADSFGILVLWGDNTYDIITSNSITKAEHTYSTKGIYEIMIYGILKNWSSTVIGLNKLQNISNWVLF